MTVNPDLVDVRLPYVIKAERLSYLIFLIILGPVIVLGLVVALQNKSAWPMPFIGIGILLLIWLVIGSFKICLLENRIVLKSLLSSHEVLYSAISRFEFGYKNTGRGPIPALFIFCTTDTNPRSIPVKSFSKKDLRRVKEILSTKAVQVAKTPNDFL